MQTLQELKDRKIEIAKLINDLESKIRSCQTEILNARKEQGIIDKSINFHNGLKNPEDRISDHAVLRILERKYGMSDQIIKIKSELIEQIKDKLFSPDCKISVGDGLWAIVQDGYVVTVRKINYEKKSDIKKVYFKEEID